MTAPTTRETADHAELAALIHDLRNSRTVWDNARARPKEIETQAAGALEILLSEIAALRGERDHFEAEFRRQCGATADQMGLSERAAHELDAVSDAIGTVRFMDPPDGGDVPLSEQVRRMSSALTQAERQRDEAVGLLRDVVCPGWTRRAWSDARAFLARLANQGADQ